MPLAEIAGELLGGAIRVAASFLSDVFFELLLKGTGYALIRSPRAKSDPGETACAIVGILFWAGVASLGWLAYRHAGTA